MRGGATLGEGDTEMAELGSSNERFLRNKNHRVNRGGVACRLYARRVKPEGGTTSGGRGVQPAAILNDRLNILSFIERIIKKF